MMKSAAPKTSKEVMALKDKGGDDLIAEIIGMTDEECEKVIRLVDSFET